MNPELSRRMARAIDVNGIDFETRFKFAAEVMTANSFYELSKEAQEFIALAEITAKTKAFNEDQPRDENGRWVEGGEGGYRLESIFSDLKEMGIPDNLNNDEKQTMLLNQQATIQKNLEKKYQAQGMSPAHAQKQAISDIRHAQYVLQTEEKRDIYEAKRAELTGGAEIRAENIMKYSVDKVESIMRDGVATIAFDQMSFFDILKSGQFGTAFSGGITKDENYMAKREVTENALLNIPADAPPEQRPVYGFITTTAAGYQDYPNTGDFKDETDHAWHEVTDVSSSYTEAYGTYRAVLKEETRDRTTITLGDTFDKLIGQPITDKPDTQTLTHMGFYNNVVTTTNANHPYYVEAQIHGGVTLNDVETLYVHEEAVPSLTAQVQAAGYTFDVKALP